MQRGTFIVLEGIDGSGKTTQLQALGERLEAVGYEVARFDFPRYAQPSSYFIKQYLNGAYGSATDVTPYTAALFYALDRYEAAPEIRQALQAGKIVLADRFTGSNFAHQGAKITNAQERSGFYIWLDNLEFQLLGIPRPTLNIILQTTVDSVQTHIDQRAPRSYTTQQRDIHEADASHLDLTARTYAELGQLFPRDFQIIDCMRSGSMLDEATITGLLWGKIEPLLPVRKLPVPEASPAKPDKTKKPALTRLSLLADVRFRSREQLLLPAGAVTPRQAKNWFYMPKQFSGDLRTQYESAMQEFRASHDLISKQLVAHFAKNEPNLSNDEALLRARETAQYVLPLATLVPAATSTELTPAREDVLVSPAASEAALRRLADESLPANHTGQGEPVTLTSFSPRNELELVSTTLYQFSDQPLTRIEQTVSTWSYDKKASTLRTYIMALSENPAQHVGDDARYAWDLITDVATFRVVSGFSREVSLQPISPRLGFDVPELVERAGLGDLFERCFDHSLSLYSQLQQAGFATEAQYACLLGHRVRWSLQIDLGGLIRLTHEAAAPQMLAANLVAEVAKNHPIIGQTIAVPNLD